MPVSLDQLPDRSVFLAAVAAGPRLRATFDSDLFAATAAPTVLGVGSAAGVLPLWHTSCGWIHGEKRHENRLLSLVETAGTPPPSEMPAGCVRSRVQTRLAPMGDLDSPFSRRLAGALLLSYIGLVLGSVIVGIVRPGDHRARNEHLLAQFL